jgi:hypothetical protein
MSFTCVGLTIRKALLILAAASLILTALSSQTATAAPTQQPAVGLPSTVVSLADVAHVYGPGYTEGTGRVVGNQDAVKGVKVLGADGSQLLHDGRVTGYSVTFSKARLTFLVNNIDQFRSSGGAQQYFQYFKTFYAHHFKRISTRAVAVGSQGLLQTMGANGTFSASVTFLQGRYIAGVTIAVLSGGKPGTSDLVKLARIDDGRIQSHG